MVLAAACGVALLAWAIDYGYQDLRRSYVQLAGLLLVGVSAALLVCFRWMSTPLRVVAAACGCVMLALGLIALSMALSVS